MKFDPVFKERFGIETPIRYTHDVILESRWEKSFSRAWKKFQKEREPVGSLYRRKRFDAFLKKLERLGDDEPYCKRVSIRFINRQVGYGVFAKVNIPPYSILNHYAGVLKPDKTISPDNDSTFLFSDFSSFSLDAKRMGNWCRFMNHGNEKINVVAWEHYPDKGPRIIFTAGHKGIKKGSQLLYNYGDEYWEDGFIKL